MVTSGSASDSLTADCFQDDRRNVLENERAGQMYAYRYNDTTVVLGTRKRDFLGAEVGIDTVANGTYRCTATNVNGEMSQDINITVQGLSLCSNYR